MSCLFLTEQDVADLIDMPRSIEVVEEAFRQLAVGKVQNVPRSRATAPGILLHSMSASAEYLGLLGWKNYTTTRAGMLFHVAAYGIETGEMQVFIEANLLGQLRTGAATGVATKFMARPESSTVGLFGTGLQARTQLEAVCAVRSISRVEVYGRDADRRRRFAEEMSERCGTEVVPVDSPRDAVSGKDIVITATTSKKPVFDGADLAEGTLVCAVGGNFLQKSEVDAETLRRSDTIVCDSIEQCRIEAGEFAQPLKDGIVSWDSMIELKDVVAGSAEGRRSADEITFFKSVGLALEDVAMAGELLRRARETGRGQALPF
jgi:ornithine cyclodeaminase/alanine dehydrogenase-like protein (mu-crystallin family)